MTDLGPDESGGRLRSNKQQRLVEAACQVFHQQGVEKSTLADVAASADIPVGNVYYYFKTKDDLVDAVIDSHIEEVKRVTGSLERLRSPQARLKALARQLTSQREVSARYGCPQGTLCSELDKQGNAHRRAAELMKAPIDWAETQFRAMGCKDARDLAVALIAAYQGISLLTNTFHDPELMTRECRRLERWIDSLA